MDQENNKITPPAERVQFILGEDDVDGSHESHPLFSELEELCGEGPDQQWRETARWIKFEEDVEEGGGRWSKPHVSTISLHSLFELRSHLLNGSVILDLDASTLEQIVDSACNKLVENGLLKNDHTVDRVKEILLRRHIHQHERHRTDKQKHGGLPLIRSLADIGRNPSKSMFGSHGTDNHKEHNNLQLSPSANSLHLHVHNQLSGSSLNNTDNNSSASYSSTIDLHHKANQAFMRKVPQGAEADNILVGEVDFLERPISIFIRLRNATMLGDLTEVPVPTRFLFILLGQQSKEGSFREIGRSLATIMSDEVFHDVAYKSKNREDLLAGIDEFLDAVTCLPPGTWDNKIRIEPPSTIQSQDFRKKPESSKVIKSQKSIEDEEEKIRIESGLTRTDRLFGGLINDIKRKAPWYLSDFTNAFALQSVASVVFLYFACLAPIITFGGLLADATGNYIATMESLLCGAICGIAYGFFSGQPLTILGSTGPVLVFETIMYSICTSVGWYYLTVRVWIGLWIGGFLFYLVATDASAFVCYITRFTEESFATLISVIFIVKAFEKVWEIRKNSPIYSGEYNLEKWGFKCNVTTYSGTQLYPLYNQSQVDICVERPEGHVVPQQYVPDVFLFSFVTFLGTYVLIVLFKHIKNTPFFTTKVRQFFSDFAVILSISTMTYFDYRTGLSTPKLIVPSEFRPTRHDRGWIVPLTHDQNPWYLMILAAFPAMLGVILIFMDQQITAVIVNRKENKLKKGCGYHLDLFVLAILIVTCSVLGLPWFVAATVLSMTHVNSLKMESESAAPGEKAQFLGVREQRVTHITIFVLCGLSIFLTAYLKHIPMPVLYGVFLFMGTSSLEGSQFFNRLLILFMPQKYQPDYMFLRHVRTYRVHVFTFVQLSCFVLLWTIKSNKQTSITFPIMLVVIIAVRKLLEYFFTNEELKALDDIIPESTKKSREDEKSDEESNGAGETLLSKSGSSGKVTIALANGNVLKIPVESCNISEQLTKSNAWKSVEDKQPRRKDSKGKKR